MRLTPALLPALFLLLGLTWPANVSAQAAGTTVFGLDARQVSVLDIGFNYTFLHANAPPGACGCFSMSGGGVSFVINSVHGFSLVADVSGGHANAVSGTAQNIGLINLLGGGRFSWRRSPRLTPFVQALAGGSNELSNYIAVRNVTGFAALGGGGVQTRLTPHLGLTLVEADYLYSRLPNGSNNHQNNLRLQAGLILRFGPR